MSKIDNETAVNEFKRFAEAWEIDTETENMNTDSKEDFLGHKKKILNAIQRGRLIFNDDGTLQYTLQYPMEGVDSLLINRPNGAALIEIDRYKEQEGMHRLFGVFGVMVSKPPVTFSKMDGIDLKPLMSLTSLFLAS
jgi:hypothetical protein